MLGAPSPVNSLPILSLSLSDLPLQPLAPLTQPQHVALDELKSFLPAIISRDPAQKEKEQKWCTDACLLRYLRATKWNVGNAMMRLKATLVWRRTFKPDEITCRDLRTRLECGQQFLSGFSRDGNPILYIIPNKAAPEEPGSATTKAYDMELKMVAFHLVRCRC
ncbi:hypothetical protein HDU91_003665 [Kappamyces sp. JEL0680]|nr:hypothetical protein HDU91_003665 [Kappamyces sp. JEL0680]